MKIRRNLINLAAALMLGLTVVACAGKTALTTEQQVYAGKWVASDGTFVQIYSDGGGDVKTSNTEVTGGSTTITADTLKIGLGPLNKEFKITKPPTEEDGKFTVELDSVVYTKQ